jgi:hypothetical protein
MMQRLLTATALAASCGLALATIPPPDAAAQAKAAEAAAKAAWQSKVDGYKLCQVQDRIAARYKSSHPKAATPVAGASAAAAGASAPMAAASALQPAPQTAPLAQGGGTPVPEVAAALKPLPPCIDPGPFAYTPPSQKPLESSEAHSPAGNATTPPSVNAHSGDMTPSKAGVAPKK